MKKVLIITYYWPPSGGSGVQRWLKFAKYLPAFNYQPVIYTVENGEYPIIDPSLEKDIPKEAIVIKKPIWEPYTFYKRFTGQHKNKSFRHGFVGEQPKGKLTQLLTDIAIYIRGNFFIPDARVFWVKPSVRFLKNYILENNIELIITTGTPHSLHLIGLQLKKELKVKWLADFRDPWTGVYYLKNLKLSAASFKKHRQLENEVLLNADLIITVGENLKKNLSALVSPENISDKIKVIANGYDTEIENKQVAQPEKFSLVYLGLFSKEQNHPLFWEALAELMREVPGLKNDLLLKFIGKTDPSIIQSIEKNGLSNYYEQVAHVHHTEVPRFQKEAALLLLSINNYPNAKEMLTGKLFEYIGSGRPILCIGPKDGDAAAVIKYTHTGLTCEWDNKAEIKKTLMHFYTLFNDQQLYTNSQHVEEYSRYALTKKLAALF